MWIGAAGVFLVISMGVLGGWTYLELRDLERSRIIDCFRIKTMEEEDLDADVFSGIPKTQDATVRLARIHQNLVIHDPTRVSPGLPLIQDSYVWSAMNSV